MTGGLQKSYFGRYDACLKATGRPMKTMSAREAKNGFGMLIDTARAEPVLVEKHGRGVVVVLSVEEYQRLYQRQGRSTGTRRQPDTWG